jgi:hypothetical protein
MVDIKQLDPELRNLYPNLTREELLRAEDNLGRYLQSTLDLYERIQTDPERYAKLKEELARLKRPK